jgi:transglutaminase-like putative cysteine protease
MLIRVKHHTLYSYNHDVTFGPTVIRCIPRPDQQVVIRSFSMQIDPEPSLLSPCLDPCGNSVITAHFVHTAPSLSITVEFEAETLRTNPFDFVITWPAALQLPCNYAPELKHLLAASLQHQGNTACAALREMVDMILDQSGNQTLEFLSRFCTHLSEVIVYELREQGRPRSVKDTLALGKGSCRDTTIVFIEGCRMVGLAARFVSGYSYSAADQHNLHAWAEVYLPGGGWRGYDPGCGLMVGDRYIACAAAPWSEMVAPIDGSFSASDSPVTPHLETSVHIEAI